MTEFECYKISYLQDAESKEYFAASSITEAIDKFKLHYPDADITQVERMQNIWM